MGEKIKASRYNHFVEIEDGKRLAFNALSCGLAEMDEENYRRYCELIERGELNGDGQDDFVVNLKKGGMVVPSDVDELDAIRAAHYRARFGGRGLSLTIIPTYACNFACDYCYEGRSSRAGESGGSGVMADDVCENIVRLCKQRLEPKGRLTVTWYGGEPLLAPRQIGVLSSRMKQLCDSLDCSYEAAIITNGFFLTKDNLEFLLSCHVTFAQVTLDGPMDMHNLRRPLKGGGDSFDTIVTNLERISDDTPFRIAIRVNIDKRNANSIPDLLDVLKARGFHQRGNFSLNFGHVFATSVTCADIATHCMVTPEFSRFLVAAYSAAMERGFRQTTYPSIMLGSCGATGMNSAVIEPNGDIQNCWETVGDPSKRTGTLTSEGIEYNHNYARWLGWTPFAENCVACNLLPVCMRGCPYLSLYRPKSLGGVSRSACTSWRYNIENMLPLIRAGKLRESAAGITEVSRPSTF